MSVSFNCTFMWLFLLIELSSFVLPVKNTFIKHYEVLLHFIVWLYTIFDFNSLCINNYTHCACQALDNLIIIIPMCLWQQQSTKWLAKRRTYIEPPHKPRLAKLWMHFSLLLYTKQEEQEQNQKKTKNSAGVGKLCCLQNILRSHICRSFQTVKVDIYPFLSFLRTSFAYPCWGGSTLGQLCWPGLVSHNNFKLILLFV